MATLKEISDRTGYSAATISRILTGDPSLSVSEEARRRVLEEAGRLNYMATRSRRGRAPKSLLRVGIAEMLTPAQQLDDPYYLYLSGFVRQGCLDRKFTCVQLESGPGSFSVPEGEPLDGIVAVGLFTPPELYSLASLSPNVVFLDSSPWENRFDSVTINYSLGIELALDHLLTLGHSKIGFIGPIWKFDDRRQRARDVRRLLFVDMMEKRSLLNPRYLIDCVMEPDATAAAVRAALAEGRDLPTAFLTANEENAIGAVWALREAGLAVPGDISVVSFNDTPRSSLVDPPLTSVSTHVDEMARTALRLLAERAAAPGKEPTRTRPLKVVVPPTIVVRDSTGPVKQG